MYTRRKQDQILIKRTAQLSINLSQQEKKERKSWQPIFLFD
jgi:hypothetical protein